MTWLAVWFCCLSLLLLTATIAQAQSSANSISFQGALTGAGGQPLANGNYNLTFKFYDVPTNGTALATSNVPNVPVTGGLVSTPIPVDAAWFNGQTRYLGISINGGTELSPRVLVTAVPYAMVARYLNGPLIDLQVPSDPEGGFWSIQPNAFVGGDGYFGIVRYAPSADWGKSLVITPQGNVAIGTLFPHSKLEVNGNAEIIGKLKTQVIDLQVPSDPDSGFWSIQPDAFFPGQFGILRYQPTADPVRSLLIAPNGNVGIGVDQPRATLDVNGTTRTKVLQITGGPTWPST